MYEFVLLAFDRAPQFRNATCVSQISESLASGNSHRGVRSIQSLYESRKARLRVFLGKVAISWQEFRGRHPVSVTPAFQQIKNAAQAGRTVAVESEQIFCRTCPNVSSRVIVLTVILQSVEANGLAHLCQR